MRILTRYIVRAHVGPFLFSLSLMTGLLLVNTVARRLQEIAGKGLDLRVIMEVFLLSIPHIIALTLPMSVLAAVLYAFGQLAAENEVTALKASGVNLVRLVAPLIFCGTLLALGMVWFNDAVLPETNHRLKNLLTDIARKSPTLQLKEQVVNEIRTGDLTQRYYLQATEIDPASNRLKDVVIYDLSQPGTERTVYAEVGQMAFNRAQTDLFLTLDNGYVVTVRDAEPASFQRIYFDRQLFRVPGVGDSLQRSGEGFRGDREMSVAMLAHEVRTRRTQLDSVHAEVRRIVAGATKATLEGRLRADDPRPAPATQPGRADFPRIFPAAEARDTSGIAGAAGPTGRASSAGPPRGGGFREPPPQASAPAPPTDLATEGVSSELQILRTEEELLREQIHSYQVEYHKKFAIPFACIAFVLIGAPLAVRFPRGGVGMVMAISLTIFTIYYIGLRAGEELGDKGMVTPFWAMWITNVIAFVLGIWGMTRVGKEISTARGGGWDDLWTALRGFFTRPFRRVARRPA